MKKVLLPGHILSFSTAKAVFALLVLLAGSAQLCRAQQGSGTGEPVPSVQEPQPAPPEPPPASDMKKIGIMKKIGALEAKVDANKLKLSIITSAMENKSQKIQNRISRYETKRILTPENRRAGIASKIEKLKLKIKALEASYLKKKSKLEKNIGRLEQKISTLEPF